MRGGKSSLDDKARLILRDLVLAEPDVTLARLVDLMSEAGVSTNDSSLSRVLAEMGLTRKKKRSSTTDVWTKT